MLVAATGVGAWAVIDKLDSDTFKILTGGIATLVVVVVVGALFIGKDLLQAYVIRRAIQQDDLSDMKQMAFIFRMMGGMRNPNVNVKIPEQQQPWSYLLQPQAQQQPWIDGAYRDTTVANEVEIE